MVLKANRRKLRKEEKPKHSDHEIRPSADCCHVTKAAEATAHRAACQLAEALRIFCEWSAQKCREMQGSVGNYAWWYVWAPVTRLRFCDQSMGREGAKSKRKVEGDEYFCTSIFFVSVLFLGFRACFLIADGSDARWTWGVMLMSSSSSNCRVCRTNSRNWNVNAVSALPRLPNKSSQRRQSQRTPDFLLQLRPGRARSRQSRQSRSKKTTPTAPPAASHRRRSLQTQKTQTRGATSKPRRQKLQPPLRGCPSLTCRKGMLQFFFGSQGQWGDVVCVSTMCSIYCVASILYSIRQF